MQHVFKEIDPDPALQFMAELGAAAFDNIMRKMAYSARQHLARLEASCFKCDAEGLSLTAHALASLLAQFGFVSLSKRITIYEFAPHFLRRSTFAELNGRLETGIEELERLVDGLTVPAAGQPGKVLEETGR